MPKRVIFYYQTFNGLSAILKTNPDVTHIHLSSIHFGTEADGQPYIHLNNLYPDHSKFDQVWSDLDKSTELGIKVLLMIGGAGGGYNTLFNNYEVAYEQLKQLLQRHPVITGVDLDIEESVNLLDVKRLIVDIRTDFPHFLISMAPIQSSLQQDVPGMGGFVYKDLYCSPEGAYIDYFNGQFYSDFTEDAYEQVIKNGYPADKVVMGSISGSGNIDVVQALSKKYPIFGGVFSWEYFNTVPTPQDWAYEMKLAMNIDLLGFHWFVGLLCSPCRGVLGLMDWWRHEEKGI